MAVVSSVCWAGFDIVRKHVGKDMTATGAVIGVTLFQTPFIAPFVAATEAGWSPQGDRPLWDLLFVGIPEMGGTYWALLGGTVALNVLANWLFLRSVQVSPLSLTTPYLSFTPVFTAIAGFLTFGEEPTWMGVAGIAVVCLGAFFLNPGREEDGWLAPLKALWTERGSFYMLIVSVLWSITPAIDKAASMRTSFLWHTWMISVGVAVFFVIYRIIKDTGAVELWREMKIHPAWLALSGFFAVGAMTLQLAAYDYVAMAYVETVKRAIGVTSAMLAGWFFFGEEDIARRLLGAVVMVVGVALVVSGGSAP